MFDKMTKGKDLFSLEVALLVVCLGLTCLLYVMQGYKMVILNLFFLPIALGGFFLGRYRAGVLALTCVIAASGVTAFQLADLAPPVSPLVVALAVAVWAAVLGLVALLIGTLSDDRISKVRELHDAYVGVVEVLTQYLQSAHPNVKALSIRIAELSQKVAAAMRLSPREIDDIRVAALLHDMGNVEITTKVIRRAVGSIEHEATGAEAHTFQGADLMLSLGSVLKGAVPLLLNQNESGPESYVVGPPETAPEIPLGARIIRAVRAYATLAESPLGIAKFAPVEIVKELRGNPTSGLDPHVLDALERVVSLADQESRAAAPDESYQDHPAPAEIGSA